MDQTRTRQEEKKLLVQLFLFAQAMIFMGKLKHQQRYVKLSFLLSEKLGLCELHINYIINK